MRDVMSMALLKKNVALCSRLENLHLHFRLQFAFSHGISGKMFSNLRQLSVFSRVNAIDLAPYKLHFSRDKSLVSQLCLRCYVRQNGQVNKNDIGLRRVLKLWF